MAKEVVGPQREGLGSWSGLSPSKKALWIILTVVCLIGLLPVIFICGILGTAVTARNIMHRFFDFRDRVVRKDDPDLAEEGTKETQAKSK